VEASHESSTEEVTQLRDCLNDLIGIMSLPVAWTGGEPPQVVSSLLDALLGMLRLAFVCARLKHPEGGPSIEVMRVAESLGETARARGISEAIDSCLGGVPQNWPTRARVIIGGIDVSVGFARLGLQGEIGILVAGSERRDFPVQTERVVLDVAATHAAIGLQPARFLSEQKRLAADLDRRVAQRASELATATEALRESERNSRLVVDSIPGQVALLTADGQVQFVNRQILEYTGRTLEELKQWGTNDTVHPDDLPRVIQAFTQSIVSGSPYEILQRLRRSDGVYRWFQNNGFPLRDASHDIVRWCVLLTDVDERKRAEDALQRSEAFLLEGQRLARVGNFSWRVGTDEIAWSEQLYRIFEFESGTPVTLDLIAARVHPEDRALINDMVERARCGVSDFEYEHRLLMPDHSVKHLHLIAHGSRDQQGRLEYIGAVQDVTQRRASEEALGQARSELARVGSVMSLGVLTASIAHEVNQPLSGIITNASTCLRMLDADPPNVSGARETARRTIRDGNRASDVITRLRALFSRKEFRLEPLDLNEATREVIALSLRDLQRNRVVVQSELADDLPTITGDRIQLQQVVLNLLRNASDAMVGVHDRPRQVLIRTERENADRVRLTVRDAGVGLDSQSLHKLFDAFYTTKRAGMGIGLSVSRSIVERHQGRLWAEPNDGPGATFSFSIPLAPHGIADAAPET
jgi:PAS domain S-box-containing protein